MTESELKELVRVVREASHEAAVGEERVADRHCRIKWRRRLLAMVTVVGGMYVVKIVTHHHAADEALHMTLEGTVALAVERAWAIFG
jgi:hypothetical protein